LREDSKSCLTLSLPMGNSLVKLIPVTVNRGKKKKKCVEKFNNSLSEKASKLYPERPYVFAFQNCHEN